MATTGIYGKSDLCIYRAMSKRSKVFPRPEYGDSFTRDDRRTG
jgi:hypothetical protein